MNRFLIFLLTSLIFPAFIHSQNNIPEWAGGIVWYQIFPERFANGDSSNDPEASKVFMNEKTIAEGWEITGWTSNWFAESGWEKKLGGRIRDNLYERRYGGEERLPAKAAKNRYPQIIGALRG